MSQYVTLGLPVILLLFLFACKKDEKIKPDPDIESVYYSMSQVNTYQVPR